MLRKRLFWDWLTLIFLSLVFICGNFIIKSNNSAEKINSIISQSLNLIQNQHDSISNNFLKNFNTEKLLTQNKENTPCFYLFKNDSLIYWNSDLNEPSSLLKLINKKNIFKQGNNYYYITICENDSLKLFTSTPLYYQNPNFNLENKFLPEIIHGEYEITFDIVNDEISYSIAYQTKMNKIDSYVFGIILIFIFIQSLRIAFRSLENNRKNKNNSLLFFIASTITYLIIIVLQNNLFISTSELFGKSCLLNSHKFSFSLAVLAEFSILFFSNIVILSSYKNKEIKLNNYLRIIFSSSIISLILLIYTYLIYELISNINIPFSFLEIYDTITESYIVLIIVGILTCGIIILLKYLMKIFISKSEPYILSLISLLIIGGIFEILLNNYIRLNYSILTNIVCFVIYFILIWEKKSNVRIKRIISDICIITLMTIQLTYILYLINETKEREEMEWFADVIGDESDGDFENKILELTDKLKEDFNVADWIKNDDFPSDDSILNYFNTKYFNIEDIKDYNKVLTLCDTSTILIFDDFNDFEIKCNDLFDNILELNHTKKISDELTLVDDPTTDSYYILKLDFSPTKENVKYCYIEFYKEYILNHIGIPEIITSHENVLMPDLVNYSFSCYEEGILQYKYGFYNYPNDLESFRHRNEKYVKTRFFKHLTKNFDERKTIIVTIEKSRLIEIIAPFSYIFIIISLMYYLNIRFNKKLSINNLRQSFHGKMQLAIILTLGFSFFVVGLTSFIFMRNSLNKKTSEFQYERNKTIVKNIEDDFIEEDISDIEYLKKFKENHFTDINIYDLNGNLINTTQPKLFDGFKSKIINRKAYEMIVLRKRFYYSGEEEINLTKYNSSYFPLRDSDGNMQAIINIPYFDNMMTSRSSMSNFIITYLNIILVLMGLSALVVILMTRKTIKPLLMIQDKMQKISLGEKNEIIEWRSNDEIGDLIKIYNHLIEELEVSANKLMRSERESAWREMARQVAHEIKNPLTPMKLNIQFLQMAWDEKNPNIDRKLRETCNSLLEQIEILSNIATAFLDYAKLPKKNIETFNIKELILNTINLYDNHQNINIELKEINESDYIISSDKNNLGIVFGNIIKNAIQAIGAKEDGLIKINITDLGDNFLINIKDNGCGISDNLKKKIFMPNFTTKSSGMGVGLSIVYDILETIGGKIDFESEVGKGTTFKINIKK